MMVLKWKSNLKDLGLQHFATLRSPLLDFRLKAAFVGYVKTSTG